VESADQAARFRQRAVQLRQFADEAKVLRRNANRIVTSALEMSAALEEVAERLVDENQSAVRAPSSKQPKGRKTRDKGVPD
jgi:hypothetical protein